ncbi:MAG: hypothetical protein J7L11_01945 [Thermoprotei archaeon]|nr:hypothetical protein [Thermoprotei archaeon]
MSNEGSRILSVAISTSLIIGIAYITSGLISLYNWSVMILAPEGMVKGILRKYIPGDLGMALILLSIGLTLLAAVYYKLRQSITKSFSCLTVGSTLAIITMSMQLLTVLASTIDSLIIGDTITVEGVQLGVLRIDSLLGYVAILLFIMSLRFYDKRFRAK